MNKAEKYEIRKGQFGWALEEMQRGLRLRRSDWTDEKTFVRFIGYSSAIGASFEGDLGDYHWQSFIALKTKTDTIVPWTPNQTDILAEDWELYKE